MPSSYPLSAPIGLLIFVDLVLIWIWIIKWEIIYTTRPSVGWATVGTCVYKTANIIYRTTLYIGSLPLKSMVHVYTNTAHNHKFYCMVIQGHRLKIHNWHREWSRDVKVSLEYLIVSETLLVQHECSTVWIGIFFQSDIGLTTKQSGRGLKECTSPVCM